MIGITFANLVSRWISHPDGDISEATRLAFGGETMSEWRNWKLCVFVFGLTALSLAFKTTCAQELDLPTLIAGIKHYDSLIQSGTGTVIYESPLAQEKRLVATFTFEGKKMRADIHESMVWKDQVQIWDGERQIYFHPKHGYAKADSLTIDWNLDPRFWYSGANRRYLELPLGDYLEKHPAKILRKEEVDGILCYVVDVSNPPDMQHLWIAPKMGFRVIKIGGRGTLGVSKQVRKPVLFMYRLFYKEYKEEGTSFWFPQRVKYEVIELTLEGELTKNYILNNTYLVKEDFKVNVDVSKLLKLDIPPDTLIFDVSSGKQIPAKEIFK